jgi:large subunit ribosomal protein L25
MANGEDMVAVPGVSMEVCLLATGRFDVAFARVWYRRWRREARRCRVLLYVGDEAPARHTISCASSCRRTAQTTRCRCTHEPAQLPSSDTRTLPNRSPFTHTPTMATTQPYIQLAQQLPPRLLHFFKRFPPPRLAAASKTSTTAPQPKTIEPASTTSPSDPNAPATTSVSTEPSEKAWNKAFGWKKNPFLPFKNPRTGNWHPPHYSLRRQAELFKLAVQHHVLPLMPTSPKHPEVKAEKRMAHGVRVKGTGVGQKVKGHHWERTLKTRLRVRQKAMEAMPDMITLWKERGHGRGWKKYPSGKSIAEKGESEIFRPEMRHAWVHQKAGAAGN